METEAFRNITSNPLQQIAPLLAKLGLPVNQDGVVEPGFIAQLAVTQRIMDVNNKLEIYKLQCMIMWISEHPKPQMNMEEQWQLELCKHLHEQVDKFAKEIFDELQQYQQAQKSKLVIPGQESRSTLMRPR